VDGGSPTANVMPRIHSKHTIKKPQTQQQTHRKIPQKPVHYDQLDLVK